MHKDNIPPPVAIGGSGGSGTRLVAALLGILGYYLGDDLNEELDNRWFSLLFKRRSALLEFEDDFRRLARMFIARMSSNEKLSEEDQPLLLRVSQQPRLQHSADWLRLRAASFAKPTKKRIDQPWCWKEPNTHVVIDRIFPLCPELRYIHVVRHPINMSLSKNQNQLYNWGLVYLNKGVTIDPRHSLAYWCEAHRRVVNFMQRWPGRTMLVDFDVLRTEPDATFAKINDFLGVSPPADAAARFKELIITPESASRHIGADLSQYRPEDLAYVEQLGYSLTS